MRPCPLLIGSALLCLAEAQANVLTVSNTNDLGPGSLHDAILEANAIPGPDEIHFNIPGAGVQKIYVNQHGLPEITDPVTIDGYTQPGARPNTRAVGNDAVILIQIDGQFAYPGPRNAIVISAGNSVVRGLSITGILALFYYGIPENPPPPPPDGDAILLRTNGGNLIEGNFLGLTPSGEHLGLSYEYTYSGVEAQSNGNRIGGTSPASRNVISRQYAGVAAKGNGTVIEGNYFGTDPSGFVRLKNAEGIVVSGANVRIGGTAPGAGNLISGCSINVDVGLSARGTIVQGNLIGPKADGSGNLGVETMRIEGSQTLVGGLDPGMGNRIAATSTGITVYGSGALGNTFLSNVFNPRHVYEPIQLIFGYEYARNDRGDADTGPNNLQNFPVITSVIRSPDSTRVIGGLNSKSFANFILQFFVDRAASDGEPIVGTRTVTTDAAGIAWFDFTFPGYTAAEHFISATATDADGNTSEFFKKNGPVQLANVATRGKVGTGDEALIGGFVIHRPPNQSGNFQKKVLIRALGPSLSGAGLSPYGCLPDPYLEVRDNTGALIAQNDNWRSNQTQEIIDSGLAPSIDLESAMVISLGDGAYTAQVRGAHGETGLGIVEVFDLDPLDPLNRPGSGRLVNISTRGRVATSDDVLIGGFIVNGNAGEPVVIRAIGPDLTGLGVPDALSDPVLELRDAVGTLLASNDNWRDAQEQEIQQTGLAPNDDRDSAILGSLIPGNYTAIVRGLDSATGIALFEVYGLGH